MKALLLYKDKVADRQQALPWNATALVQDLELNTLFRAMAKEDEYILDACKRIVLISTENNIATIVYRQQILQDCIQNRSTIMQLYTVVLEALEVRKKNMFGIFSSYPSSILSGAIGMMRLYVDIFRNIREIAAVNIDHFTSEGFNRFFKMLQAELNEDYLNEIIFQLNDLQLRDGILVSARLGRGSKGTGYVLHRWHKDNVSWIERIFHATPDVYSFNIHPRDESAIRALSELKDSAINNIASDLAQSCDHIFSFFTTLRYELAFYKGCLNLEDQLSQTGMYFSFATPANIEDRSLATDGLYDICLALVKHSMIIPNDLHADNKNPVIITGANQGGKSTFLRSIGIAQLMLQAGLFFPAKYARLSTCDNLFTHFKREEDQDLKSGKFDEELNRMNIRADKITPGAMILFNESFASTNEREGSEIAAQVVYALVENNTRVMYVTHLYAFAHNMHEQLQDKALFLRAERAADQQRTFKINEGAPLETSYGIDLYKKIFNDKQQ